MKDIIYKNIIKKIGKLKYLIRFKSFRFSDCSNIYSIDVKYSIISFLLFWNSF